MALGQFSSRSSLAFYAVVGFCLAAFAAFAFANFGDLFLLIEYRERSDPARYFNFLEIFDPRHIADARANSVANSRDFASVVSPAIGAVCGTWPACHNAAQILLLIGAAFFVAAALRKLFPDAPLVLLAGAVLFPLFSEVSLDALAWQSTINDKLSMFFTALAMYLVARIDPQRFDRRSAIVANAGVLLAVVAAYNSKEGTLTLVPSLLGLLAVRSLVLAPRLSRDAAVRAVRDSFTYLAAPALYALLHIVLVLRDRVFLEPVEYARVAGGSWTVNLYHAVLYVFTARPMAESLEKFPYMPQNEIDAFAAGCIVAVIVVIALVMRYATWRMRLYWAWAFLSFIAAMLIPLRTATLTPFYLLVPLVYLTVLCFLTALVFLQAFPERRASAAIQAAVIVVLASHMTAFFESVPPYRHVETMSKNFTAMLAQLRAQLERTPRPSHVEFYWPQDERKAYMFLVNSGARRLGEFVLPAGSSAADDLAFDAAIADQPYPPGKEPRPPTAPRTISVILGEDLRLVRIVPPAP